jgi:hypothetical protein
MNHINTSVDDQHLLSIVIGDPAPHPFSNQYPCAYSTLGHTYDKATIIVNKISKTLHNGFRYQLYEIKHAGNTNKKEDVFYTEFNPIKKQSCFFSAIKYVFHIKTELCVDHLSPMVDYYRHSVSQEKRSN